MKHHISFGPSIHGQRGISMLLVLVLISIMILASASFQNNLVNSARLSGATRSSTASMMLAESAMENLRGGFINSLDSLPSGHGESFCGEGGGPSHDWCEAFAVVSVMKDATELEATLTNANLDYVFHVGGGTVSATAPSLLQAVANGSATASDEDFCSVQSRVISLSTCKIKINDLFGGNAYSPRLYTTNENGLLVDSGESSWDVELARTDRDDDQPPTAAAAWIEVTANIDPESGAESGGVDFWIQAAGQVGIATSYVQRYMGTYYPGNTVGVLATLIEASEIELDSIVVRDTFYIEAKDTTITVISSAPSTYSTALANFEDRSISAALSNVNSWTGSAADLSFLGEDDEEGGGGSSGGAGGGGVGNCAYGCTGGSASSSSQGENRWMEIRPQADPPSD